MSQQHANIEQNVYAQSVSNELHFRKFEMKVNYTKQIYNLYVLSIPLDTNENVMHFIWLHSVHQ